MRQPRFWKKKNYKSISLLPFTLIYFCIYLLNIIIKIKGKSKLPVICIGNAVVGGSGKTPVSIEIGKILKDNGIKFCYLSRGYKRKTKGVIKVKKTDNFKKVGDEPLLLKNISNVCIAENRYLGAK
ncbi:tetraacyldisaccharide 4'-kinase, partial [Pseudomonadota bacterium]